MSISRTAQSSTLAAFFGLVTTSLRRCGRPLYAPSSTRLGSTRIRRTWSGVQRMSSEVTSELMQLLLPAPVAPAMSTCGSVARSIITERPSMSRPRPTARVGCDACASGAERTSPRVTSSRCLFGTSTPIALRPGIGARMRTSGDAIAYWMSCWRPVTRLTFTPGPRSSAYCVTDGPTVMPISLASTPCCASVASSTRPPSSAIRWSAFLVLPRLRMVPGGRFHGPWCGTASSPTAIAS